MSQHFIAFVAVGGGVVSREFTRRYTTQLASSVTVYPCPGDRRVCVVIEGHHGDDRLCIARTATGFAVGDVRFDNRNQLDTLVGTVKAPIDDRALLLTLFETHGAACFSKVLGDFACLLWREQSATATMLRDAFGVRRLYYTLREGCCVIASRADWLADGDRYDREFIVEFLLNGCDLSTRSMFAGVTAVPPGGYVTAGPNGVSVHAYWRATDYVPMDSPSTDAAVEEFRELFIHAVRACVEGRDDVWAQLSGGLDSSSVVSVASYLSETDSTIRPLGGTVTYVDSLGSGDERDFARHVLEQYELVNHTVEDYWPWRYDELPPPITDEPNPLYPFFARDRRMCAIVRAGGGRVLLSGQGSDNYLTGSQYYLADLMSRGRVVTAVRETLRWTVSSRASFWYFSYENALKPLLPRAMRRRLIPARSGVPRWIRASFARQLDATNRLMRARAFDAIPGHRYASEIVTQIASLPGFMLRGPFEDGLEVRYPFLYRPLVEFALRLPPTLRSRPRRSKWVLREAMQGLLPDAIRQRSGKGTIGARVRWGMSREKEQIDWLLDNPILGQLGCVSPSLLRRAVRRVQEGRKDNITRILAALSLETWLRVRSGQWNEQKVEQLHHAGMSQVNHS